MSKIWRIGVTGHMNLSSETVPLVRRGIRRHLEQHADGRIDLVGVSCLAAGADTIFAEEVIDAGGRLEVVLPSSDYQTAKVDDEHRGGFDRLVAMSSVTLMPFATANRAAYEAANTELLSRCDELVAVWDGQSPADQGGTAAVVAAASLLSMAVVVVWPDGSRRS